MTVWIVNPFDNLPGEGRRAQRYSLMAREFARAGHRVIFWSSAFSHADKCRRRTPGGGLLPEKMEAEGVEIRLLPTLAYRRNVGLKRILSHFLWARAWARAAKREGRQNAPGLVISSSPPLLQSAAAIRLAKRFGATAVIDIQDAWPETFARVLPKWLLAPLKVLAGRNYRAADKITAVADRYLELARAYGFKGEAKRFYLGIGTEAEAVPRTQAEGRLVYAGSLGRSYDLKTVIEALAMRPGWTLDIAGSGEGEAGLGQLADSLGVPDRVRFHGYLGDAKLKALLRSCSIGIVPMSGDSFVGLPNKFADYANAGLAIASSLSGESADLLAESGAGVVYKCGDAGSLVAAIDSLMPRLPAAQTAAAALCRREFDAAKIYRSYLSFVLQ